MDDEKLDLPREQFEPVISQSMDLEFLGTEITVFFHDLDGWHEFRTCYGDICKTVNALRDYSKTLEMVCDSWDIQGFHRATYEYYAKKLREIAEKFQAGIGYDYDAAVEKCKKRAAKKSRDDEPGGEAMTMAYLKSRQTVAAKKKKADEQKGAAQPAAPDEEFKDSPWEEDF